MKSLGIEKNFRHSKYDRKRINTSLTPSYNSRGLVLSFEPVRTNATRDLVPDPRLIPVNTFIM
jgi:hypothetical protein